MNALSTCKLRYATFDQLIVGKQQTADNWLSASERSEWQQFSAPERLQSFLAGRIVAKRLLRELGVAVLPTEISILCEQRGTKRDRPTASVNGEQLQCSLSISHSDESVLVGVTLQGNCTVGVDLVPARDLGAAFTRCWLTSAEQDLVSAHSDITSATLWALKEAVYKACQRGESFAPRQIELSREGEYWCAAYRCQQVRGLCTWRVGDYLAALAVRDGEYEALADCTDSSRTSVAPAWAPALTG